MSKREYLASSVSFHHPPAHTYVNSKLNNGVACVAYANRTVGTRWNGIANHSQFENEKMK